MFTKGMRRFATTAYRMAELSAKVDASNHYRVQLAKAQGHVDGFVGGKDYLFMRICVWLTECASIQQLGTHP